MGKPWEEEDTPQVQEAGKLMPWEEGADLPQGDSHYRDSASSEDSEWDNFWHAFSKMKSFTESAGDVMEQYIPMGRIQITNPETGELDIEYQPPSDELKAAAKAGDDEWAASIINAERDIRLQKRFPHLYRNGIQREGTENIGGSVAGAIVDPTSLIPFIGGIKTVMATGAAFGAADGYLYSKGTTGRVDPTHVALGATLGAVLPASLKGVGKSLGFVRTKASGKLADKMLNRYEKELAAESAQGVAPDMARVTAAKNSGIYDNGVELDELYKATGRTEPAFSSASQARETLESIESRAASNWLTRGVLNVGKAIEPFVGTISTRVRNISPKIFNTLRKLDLDTHVDVHKYYERLEPFSKQVATLKRYDKGTYNEISKGLMGEDFTRAGRMFDKLAKENPTVFGNMADNFSEVRKVLDEIYDGYKGAGYKMKRVQEYFPKLVTSPEGVGIVRHGIIKDALAKAQKIKKRPLTKAETDDVVNTLIRHGGKDRPTAKVSKHIRARKFDHMTEAMLPHYAELNDSLHAYVRQGVHDIQRRRWLGNNGAKLPFGRTADPKGHDLVHGLGKVVADETNRLNLNGEQQRQLMNALTARFGKGEQASSIGYQHFKNISYGTTLGNIYSAITQFGDNAFGMYINGIRNQLKGMFGEKIIKKTHIGLSDISEDLVNDVSKTKQFLDWTLKWSGFSRMDKFGKESLLNGAMHKYTKQLKSDKGRRDFVAKWGRYFEGDMPALMKKVKAGEFDDDNVRLLLWHTLSDVQPIGLSEMPEKYLNHPNGRVFYMLKTFTIKQFDIMRREIGEQIRRGNHEQAAKNAARFGILFGLVNGSADMFKDMLSGKDINVTDNMVNNMVKLVGLSRYQTRQMNKDGVGQVLFETLLPPTGFIDKPVSGALQADFGKAIEPVPVVGKLISRHMRE